MAGATALSAYGEPQPPASPEVRGPRGQQHRQHWQQGQQEASCHRCSCPPAQPFRPFGPAGSLTAGINIGPLMASVGGIGLAVGLATQNLAANVVAALAL